jgi:LacI family transcriptional regulator
MKSTLTQGAKAKAGPVKSGTVVTLDMVAARAGVSPSTVSRILNGTAIVSSAKKQAVDAAIEELGFVPNPVARGLAGGRTMSIGVVTQAIDSPFYGAAMRGIEDMLDPVGFSPLFVSGHWDEAAETRCVEVLRSRRVDGIIVLTGRLSDQALKNYAKSLPVVVTGRRIAGPGLIGLNFDSFEGGRLATQHLIDLGHRHIAFVSGDAAHPDANERFRGYCAALQAASIAVDSKLVVPGGYHEVDGLQAVDHLIATNQRFTAIFAANDQMALGAMLGLHKRSLRVPDDVSVVGFDDLPNSMYVTPPLTTIDQPAFELGQLAASAMLSLLAGEKPCVDVPAPRLIARESSRRLLA